MQQKQPIICLIIIIWICVVYDADVVLAGTTGKISGVIKEMALSKK